MTVIKSIFIILILINSLPVVAKTIVISDVDDTIKISHVHTDILKRDWNIAGNKNFFHAMPEFFQQLNASDIDDFYYVTNMTLIDDAKLRKIGSGHGKFLKKSKFPDVANLFMAINKVDRGNCEINHAHKLKTIRSILSNVERESDVILIGDNSENDPCFYDTIANEYKDSLNIHQFIRIAYGDSHAAQLFPGQMPFVSPVEVALSLLSKNLVTQDLVAHVANNFVNKEEQISRLPGRSALRFPKWVNCSSHKLTSSQNIMRQFTWELKAERDLQSTFTLIQRHCR